MSTPLLATLMIVTGLSALVVPLLMLVYGLEGTRAYAIRGNAARGPRWARIGAIVAAALLLFSTLLTAAFTIGGVIARRVADTQLRARQARYEQCLERTAPAVCEIHQIVWPRPSDHSPPTVVIGTDGKIGIGLGL